MMKKEQFNWVRPTKNSNENNKYDVSITLQRLSGKTKTGNVISFTFKNHINEVIAPSGYMSVAAYKNRVFFQDDEKGYKVTHSSAKDNRYLRLSIDNSVDFMDFIGDYELKYDDFYEFYYIEKIEKNAKNGKNEKKGC